MLEDIAIKRVESGIVDVGGEDTFAEVIEYDGTGDAPRRRKAFSCNSAQIRELDWKVNRRTDLRLKPRVRTNRRMRR